MNCKSISGVCTAAQVWPLHLIGRNPITGPSPHSSSPIPACTLPAVSGRRVKTGFSGAAGVQPEQCVPCLPLLIQWAHGFAFPERGWIRTGSHTCRSSVCCFRKELGRESCAIKQQNQGPWSRQCRRAQVEAVVRAAGLGTSTLGWSA